MPSPVARARITSSAMALAASLLAATSAHAQRGGGYVECFRDGREVSCDDSRSARERALDRARATRDREAQARADARARADVARAQAAEQVREQVRARLRAADWRREEERRRLLDRSRDARRAIETARLHALAPQRRYFDDFGTRISLGGGGDMRRFGERNRYLATAAVDFRARSGIGLRPEVVFGWSDRQRELLPVIACIACSATVPVSSSSLAELHSRSQMLGVNLNATYMFVRGSFVRPYVIAGVGVFSTRETTAEIASSVPLASNPQATVLTYRPLARDRVDLGLNGGTGLEFGRGPVRLYTEFRYFLNDTSTPRGFSGMLPITVGLRF